MRACDTNLSREAPTKATKQQGHNACSKHSLLRPPNSRVNCLWLFNPTPCAASSESQEHVATGSSRLQAHTQPSHPIPSHQEQHLHSQKRERISTAADVLHQQSPAFSSAAATQLPKGQETQNPAWSSGQIQGSLSVFTTKTVSFKLQLPALQNPHSTGKIPAVFQSSPSSTNQLCIQHNFQHRAVEAQTPSSFSS